MTLASLGTSGMMLFLFHIAVAVGAFALACAAFLRRAWFGLAVLLVITNASWIYVAATVAGLRPPWVGAAVACVQFAAAWAYTVHCRPGWRHIGWPEWMLTIVFVPLCVWIIALWGGARWAAGWSWLGIVVLGVAILLYSVGSLRQMAAAKRRADEALASFDAQMRAAGYRWGSEAEFEEARRHFTGDAAGEEGRA